MEPIFIADPNQEAIADFEQNNSVFLKGPASTGKTTAAIRRLSNIISSNPGGISEPTLVLVPQRSLAAPYLNFLNQLRTGATDQVSVQTMSSLVRRMVDLFWPLMVNASIFKHPFEKPRFLTLETSQYYMAQIVSPMLDQGKFNTVSLPLYRLCSQLLDNLNKSSLVGFPYTEIGSRLSSAWIGDPVRQNVFFDVQEAVAKFRQLCLDGSLVDYSLQVELFTKVLWTNPTFQKYFQNQYRHLIYDNSEEDPPYVHDCLLDWLPGFESSLVIMDEKAGFRSFLGADPTSALRFADSSAKQFEFHDSYVSSAALIALRECLFNLQYCEPDPDVIRETLVFPTDRIRFFPDLLEALIASVDKLVGKRGVDPSRIVVVSPFISDSLQFSLENGLAERGIKNSIQKPSVPLAQNAVSKTLITFAKLAHPSWQLTCDFHSVASSLSLAIKDLDLIRAHVILGGFEKERIRITTLGDIAEPNKRIPANLAGQYFQLKHWLEDIDEDEPLDNFFSRLFGELLSQPGYGFHSDTQAGTSTAILMESYRKFQQALRPSQFSSQSELGRAFVDALESGLIPGMYLSEWQPRDPDAVLLAPVTSFLMRNEPVDYQFWLNIGSKGWYERLEQPLTHPIVLSRNWSIGRQWSAEEEQDYNLSNIEKVVSGLIARCREQIFVFSSVYNESGIEERGELLTLFQNLLRKSRQVNHGS